MMFLSHISLHYLALIEYFYLKEFDINHGVGLVSQNAPHFDSAFPGENWFFYWKTSPALWESKLRDFSNASPIFVPINWAFHVLDPEHFDFADQKPETDLKKLFLISKKLGRDIYFLLPLGPQPYLPNGGIPNFLARATVHSQTGLVRSVVDNEERVNKMYSFFDPKIYQVYRKFVWHFGQYLSTNGIESMVFGAQTGFIEEGRFGTFFDDTSEVYEQAFNRFLKQQTAAQQINSETLTPQDLVRYKIEFLKLIKELYSQSAKECLGHLWGGEIDFAFLGGAESDIFPRSSYIWEQSQNYFDHLFDSIANKIVPSSVLIGHEQKSPVLVKAFQDFFTSGFIYKKLDTKLYEDDYLSSFTPLVFFEIYMHPALLIQYPQKWSQLGLMSFFKREYKWGYTFNYNNEINLEEDYINEKIHLFSGHGLTKDDISRFFKLFMNGAKVVLDKSGLDADLNRKLELFFLENKIQVEKINFNTEIINASLGDGRFLIFDGEKLEHLGLTKKLAFWESIFSSLKIKHLKIQDEDEFYYFWKFRTPKMNEMNYEQIRRISFYNPTQFKKRAKIIGDKNFALIKIIDEVQSVVRPSTIGVDVEVGPYGSVSLDFGYFE